MNKKHLDIVVMLITFGLCVAGIWSVSYKLFFTGVLTALFGFGLATMITKS